MEQRVLEIVEKLDSAHIADLERGIDLLDDFLYEMLHNIRQYHELGNELMVNQLINLQDNFEYNIVSRLLNYYKAIGAVDYGDYVIKAHQCLQGMLLLHRPSQRLFNRANNLQLVVKLLDSDDIEIIMATITTIIHILLKDLANFRAFESIGGCSKIIKHLDLDESIKLEKVSTSNKKQQNLNFKVIEFLFFYLIDESNMKGATKTVEEKSQYFKNDFPEIDQLIKSLRELQVESNE